MPSPTIKRAILSVSDKTGLAELARGLVAQGVELVSSGGTRRHLAEHGIEAQEVSAYTGSPEMLGGRVKTLHPKVHGGILARHDREDDQAALAEHGIAAFELVVVNLYPFEQTIAAPGVSPAEAIEQIDIGGPALVRAAAKNHASVTIATDPSQYGRIFEQVQTRGGTTAELRRELAAAAFALTARYDRAIADYFARLESGDPAELFPARLTLHLERRTTLRYGENPHQQAALYERADNVGANLLAAEQLGGKELSYNNLLDLDAALGIVRLFEEPAAAVIKHTNPCGAAIGESPAEAVKQALAGDPVSAFGSVLGFNRPVDRAAAEVLAEPGLFIEAIVAPAFGAEALEILRTRPKWKTNVRLLEVGPLDAGPDPLMVRHLDGGLLLQGTDVLPDEEQPWRVVTEAQPDDALHAELRFAWAICRHVKSNAIALAQNRALVGVGAGQMSRVDSVEIAISKAGERAAGSVLASDAFFPFDDSIHRAAEAGVKAVIQPGGSRRDEEVIAACNQHGLPMIFTGRRHFKH